jgi:8-oxo-dGTP diphosphatase
MVFNKRGQILLGLRKGAHWADHWACPGGWLDRPDESTVRAVKREAREEAGLAVYQATEHCWTTRDCPELEARTVTLYHITEQEHDQWRGEPEVLEPEKCERWEWFDTEALPSPLFPGVETAIDRLKKSERARAAFLVEDEAATITKSRSQFPEGHWAHRSLGGTLDTLETLLDRVKHEKVRL